MLPSGPFYVATWAGSAYLSGLRCSGNWKKRIRTLPFQIWAVSVSLETISPTSIAFRPVMENVAIAAGVFNSKAGNTSFGKKLFFKQDVFATTGRKEDLLPISNTSFDSKLVAELVAGKWEKQGAVTFILDMAVSDEVDGQINEGLQMLPTFGNKKLDSCPITGGLRSPLKRSHQKVR